MIRIILVVAMLFVISPLDAAQPDWLIILSDGSEIEAQDLSMLMGDSLIYTSGIEGHALPIAQITGLRHKAETQILKGMGIGFLSGAAVGGVLGYRATSSNEDLLFSFSAEETAIFGATLAGAGGTLVGAIAGAVIPGESQWSFADLNLTEKRVQLEMILQHK